MTYALWIIYLVLGVMISIGTFLHGAKTRQLDPEDFNTFRGLLIILGLILLWPVVITAAFILTVSEYLSGKDS